MFLIYSERLLWEAQALNIIKSNGKAVSHWLDKVSEILEAETSDLGQLALIAGGDPKTFYSGTEVRKTIEGQKTPADFWGWIRRGDNWIVVGSLANAKQAFESARELAEKETEYSHEISLALIRIGDVYIAEGNINSGLKYFRDSLAIADRLAKADPGNAGWQRDLSVSYDRIGDVQVKQGALTDALQSFRDSLAIRDRLAKADPGNAGWQRDLSVSYDRIGDVQVAQGALTDALQSFRDSLAIADRLAKADPGNAGWQRDLSVSFNKIGDVQVKQGALTDALQSFRDSLAIADRLAKADPGNVQWQTDLVASNAKLALAGDEPVRRWNLVVTTLRRLKAEDKLTAEQAMWLPVAEDELAKARGK
jgi:tetratricopeptide (TPR) repeat protein